MKDIQTEIRQTIPLAQAMEFEILLAEPLKSLTRLPLEQNRNHLGTLFGGSLYAASALSSYACLLAALKNEDLRDCQIVIVEGKIKYLLPGTGDALVSAWTQPDDYAAFLERLKTKGRGRILYQAQLKIGDQVLCSFEGLYQVKKITRR